MNLFFIRYFTEIVIIFVSLTFTFFFFFSLELYIGYCNTFSFFSCWLFLIKIYKNLNYFLFYFFNNFWDFFCNLGCFFNWFLFSWFLLLRWVNLLKQIWVGGFKPSLAFYCFFTQRTKFRWVSTNLKIKKKINITLTVENFQRLNLI